MLIAYYAMEPHVESAMEPSCIVQCSSHGTSRLNDSGSCRYAIYTSHSPSALRVIIPVNCMLTNLRFGVKPIHAYAYNHSPIP